MIILMMMMMIGRALPPEGDIFGYTLKKRFTRLFSYLGQYLCDILFLYATLLDNLGNTLGDTFRIPCYHILFATLGDTCVISCMIPHNTCTINADRALVQCTKCDCKMHIVLFLTGILKHPVLY